MEGIREPVSPRLHALLRRAVLDHARSERRRSFAPLIHVGTPGGVDAVFALTAEDPSDHALRTDLVAALLCRMSRPGLDPIVWLTRPGDLTLQDVDVAWLTATRDACAEVGRSPTMVVVTRNGWRDPRSEVARVWKRLRQR